MLVLSRKLNESIQIGSNITLTITRVQGGRVQVGIVAPREVAIRRSGVDSPGAKSEKISGDGQLELRKSA